MINDPVLYPVYLSGLGEGETPQEVVVLTEKQKRDLESLKHQTSVICNGYSYDEVEQPSHLIGVIEGDIKDGYIFVNITPKMRRGLESILKELRLLEQSKNNALEQSKNNADVKETVSKSSTTEEKGEESLNE